MKRFVIYFLILFSFSLVACDQSVNVKSKHIGFYYWQTTLNLSNEKLTYLKDIRAKRLYIRLFDIDTSRDRNGNLQAIPISIIRNQSALPDSIELVPVVYFTRQAIKSCGNLDTFSSKIYGLVTQLCASYHWDFSEIQWDYDWTPSTKEIYFELLRKLKSYPTFDSKIFSSTIRLHQVKHRSQSGIPPVDKGLLMCYNMGNLKQYGSENSILDIEMTKDYLSSMQTYPLKLDVAFPLFNWGVLFRNQQFSSLLNDVSLIDIEQNAGFTQLDNGMFRAIVETEINGYQILKNDEIRIEEIENKELKKVITFVSHHNNNDSLNLLFFHLNESILTKYPTHELQQIIDAY
jgi:hypothetical protein